MVIARRTRDRIIETLWANDISMRTEVWMILDCARDPRIFGAVDGCYLDKTCLYSGDLPWQLQMAAPYLVELKKEDRFTAYVLDNGWGQSWGVFLRTETGMKTLRHHLRGFLRVRDTAGRRLLFRYYDPRVLRAYLPTCFPAELKTIYGPIDHFLMEAEEPGTMLEFGLDKFQLVEKRIPLEARASA